jgi:hypothetical protein
MWWKKKKKKKKKNHFHCPCQESNPSHPAHTLVTILIEHINIQVEVFCSVVVGNQHFRGPCTLHLPGKVASMGENGIDIGLDWKGVAGGASTTVKASKLI